MSSRELGALLILSTSTIAGMVAIGTAGCSDHAAVPADAGTESSSRANRPAPPETDAEPSTCEKQCEEAHPKGLLKDEAINSCWKTYCREPCLERMPDDGGIAPDGAAPDGAAPDVGTCVSPVVTISLACDECTTASCCIPWDGCFQDSECTALNACYQQCTD